MKLFFKSLLIGIVFTGLALGGLWLYGSSSTKAPAGTPLGGDFSFTSSPTQATTTIGNYAWVQFATTTPNMGFASICDNADTGVNVNNPLYLGFGTTSPVNGKPFGYRLRSGECYVMTPASNNMFYGKLYSIASTATSTLISTFK